MKLRTTYFVLFALLTVSLAQAEDMAESEFLPLPTPEVSADALETLPFPEGNTSVTELPAMPEATQKNGGVKFSLLYNTANKGKFEAVNSYDQPFTGEDIFSGGTPGASVEYSYRQADSLGFSAGVAYQGNRTMKSWTAQFLQSGNVYTGNYRIERKLSLLVPAANLNYSFGGTGLYGFVGPNYSIPSYTSAAGDKFGGRLGWQIGAGYEAVQNVYVDLTYQRLNFKYTDEPVTFSSYSMSGAMLQLGYRI